MLNADAGLFSADYRAPERLFAQLVQVAGRAGRADLPGEVLIQTHYPGHPLYQALAQHDYAGFARTLLAEREQAGFPPFIFEAVLRAEAPTARTGHAFPARRGRARGGSGRGRDDLRSRAHDPGADRRQERAQLLVQSPSRARLQPFLAAWSAALYAGRFPGVRWHIDVDPTEF